MSNVEVDYILGELLPDWPSTPQDPPGNYYASQLKKIHDFSKEVLPPSSHSTDKSRLLRWTSRYKTDYIPLLEGNFRGSTKSAPLGGKEDQSKMFMNWKVPRHLLGETNDSSPRSASAIVRAFDEVKPVSSRGIPTPGEVLRREKTTLPAISPSRIHETSVHSAVRSSAPSRLSAGVQSAREPLTSLPRSSACRREEQAVPATPLPVPVAAVPPQPLPRASAALKRGPSKALATQQVLRSYNKSDLEKKAEVYLQTATEEERRLVEKVLRLAGSKGSSASDHSAMQRWLSTASHRDRKVALQFFQSAAGSQLVGSDADKKDRNNNIINALEKGQRVEVSLRSNLQKGKDTRLQYIRLLTPGTRENRWMHTTWHHLPVYRDYDPVNNASAVYTMPHKPIPREFKIHPDWGP